MFRNPWPKRLLPILALSLAALYAYDQERLPDAAPASQVAATQSSTDADRSSWQAGEWVVLEAEVRRVLDDDEEGSRHQRFIIELPDQRTLLVTHNIDLAERVPLDEGDIVRLRGRFEPNARGGVVHWTHHDPAGRASAGWIEHRRRRYQ